MGMDARQVSRLIHIGVFPLDPETGEEQESILLFAYQETDLLGTARIFPIG